jgi:hypothetical protein
MRFDDIVAPVCLLEHTVETRQALKSSPARLERKISARATGVPLQLTRGVATGFVPIEEV